MTAQRAIILAAGALTLAATAAPATAQVDDEVVLNIMRECARIDDPTARLACYDNNIRSAGADPRSTVPGDTVVEGSGAPPSSSGPSGFGREDVRTPDRFREAPPGELAEITSRVSSIRQREPGIYAFTLEDGAQWVFTDGVALSYRPPRAGSSVTIQRAAMGSFLMRFDNQPSVRVERIR